MAKRKSKSKPLSKIAASIDRRGTRGTLTAYAKRTGGWDSKNRRIKYSWLRKVAKRNDVWGRRARAALAFRKGRKG